jgi:flagellar FliL protein
MKTLHFLLFLVLLQAAPALAEGGEGKGGEVGPYAKLQTFIVNPKEIDRYLQTDISLKIANSDVNEALVANMPIVRHEVILLLSSQSSSDVATPAGKQKLAEDIRNHLNTVLHRDARNGVLDVLFESFIIQ